MNNSHSEQDCILKITHSENSHFFFPWKFVLHSKVTHSEDHHFLFLHGSLFCILKFTGLICSSMEVCHEFHNHQLFFSFAFSFPPNEVCSSGLSYLSGGLIDCAIRCQHSFCGITNSSWVLIFKHKFRLWAFHRQINRYWISFLPTFYKYFKPFHSIHRITLLISSITL